MPLQNKAYNAIILCQVNRSNCAMVQNEELHIASAICKLALNKDSKYSDQTWLSEIHLAKLCLSFNPFFLATL